MGTVATVKRPVSALKAKVAILLMLVPVTGVSILIWKASHTIAKPDISIYRAAERGLYKEVEAHILTGTPVNSLSGEGHSPLYFAVLSGKRDVVDLLLDNGANPDAEGVGQTSPLYAAAGQGDLQMVKDLIAAGANPAKERRGGDTPLSAAAESGNPEVVKLLLAKGANPNATLSNSANTALCNACIKGNIASVQALLDAGAKVDVRGFSGRTPLHFAVVNGNYGVAKLLLEHGADADERDDNYVPPLSTALTKHVDEKISWLLLDHMKKVQGFDYHSCNPLHYAADSGASVKMIQALIAHGCNPNQTDFQGDTPLDMALAKGRKEIEAALVQGGARVSLRQMIRQALEPKRAILSRGNTQPIE